MAEDSQKSILDTLSKACQTHVSQYPTAFIKHWSQTDLILEKNKGDTETQIPLQIGLALVSHMLFGKSTST